MKIILLLAAIPLLNFLHESGHWLGAKLVGADPKMLLQRVDVGDESQFSATQITIYNWGGPAINYAFIGASFLNPSFVPLGIMMACHRLGPNVFASYLYLKGNHNFTTDETKQFSKDNRLWAAILFSLFYLALAVILVMLIVPSFRALLLLAAIPTMSLLWFWYLIFLDYLDKRI